MGIVPFVKSQDPRRIPLEGKILVAHQAEFLPWLGFVSKATMGDIFLILDDTQYKKKYFENRNKIRFKNKEGWIWLNIPCKCRDSLPNMMDVTFNGLAWRRIHLKTIETSYSRCKCFDEIFPEIYSIYENISSEFLVDFNVSLIKYAFKKFKIEVPVYRVSELKSKGINIQGVKSDLVLSLCEAVNADVLIAGISAKEYLVTDIFKRKHIDIKYQEFLHPIYDQYHGEFISHLSFIDLLFNHGSAEAIKILGNCKYS